MITITSDLRNASYDHASKSAKIDLPSTFLYKYQSLQGI